MVDRTKEDPPFEGGAQPVPERPAEVPRGGRTTAQTIVIVIGALVVLAAVLWLLVPFGG